MDDSAADDGARLLPGLQIPHLVEAKGKMINIIAIVVILWLLCLRLAAKMLNGDK